ncbi:hypothetical protein DL96DRAFT_1563719 [Flagelloscypha sp. PMI_526]|nr:hypothetical protein DL96DRAFT_1563719 [Flagelloscypha sp. PMI_526]
MSATPLSIQSLAKGYNNISNIAYMYNLETFVMSLCYGLVLILSITALARLRHRRRSSPTHSLRWLYFVILTQLIFVTLRFSCQIGENLAIFKQTRFLPNPDGRIEKISNVAAETSRLGINTVVNFSGRLVEALANGVVVWRAWTLYLEVRGMKYFLVIAWFCDLAAGIVYFGVSVAIMFKWMTHEGSKHQMLTNIVMYSSRWSSFALNLVATILIGYRTWKLRGMLKDVGLTPTRSSVYTILARLVETGVILLTVQFLVAILAVTFTSGDPADPGFVALNVLVDVAFMIINAHPAGMALVTGDVWAREEEGSGDTEANCNTTFRAANNPGPGSFSESSGKSGFVVYPEKTPDHT